MTKDHVDSTEEEIGLIENIEGVPFDLNKIKKVWDVLTHGVSREKMSVATYLQDGVPYEVSGETLTVAFPSRCKFQKESLEDEKIVQLVEHVFSDKLNSPVIVRYKIIEDCEPQEEAENIKEALDTFSGKVVNRWHQDQ
jgi:hypothetical protein